MKFKNIFGGMMLGGVMILSSCSLGYNPIDTYSDVTEGVQDKDKEVVFKDKEAVVNHRQSIYKTLRDGQEHWYLDLDRKSVV